MMEFAPVKEWTRLGKWTHLLWHFYVCIPSVSDCS